MSIALLLQRRFFNRCLMMGPDIGGSPGTALAGPIAVDPAGLEFLPGGDMLLGATVDAPVESNLPNEWTEENAQGDDDEKPAVTDEVVVPDPDKPAEEVVPVDPTPDQMAEWPEEARTYAERIIAEKATAAAELATLKTEKETLAAELVTARSAQPPAAQARPVDASPLFGVRDEKSLTAHETLAEDLAEWAADNVAAGGTMSKELQARMQGRKVEEIGDPEFFDPETIKQIRGTAKTMLKQHIPAQREFLKAETASAAYLREHHPKFVDPASEEGKIFVAFAAQAPGLKSHPAWPIIMADTVRGYMARMAEEKAPLAAKGKPAAPATPLAPKPPGAVRAGSGTPVVQKPARPAAKLSASMTAAELAAL